MKVQKSKNKKINTSIQDKSTDLNNLNSVRLLNNVTFPTIKKRTADADEDAKRKHLPPGRAHHNELVQPN